MDQNQNGNQQEYKKLSKFDLGVSGLTGGNNLPSKAVTIQNVSFTGEMEQFTVQTIRAEYKVTVQKGWETTTQTKVGDFVVMTYLDNDGPKRLIVPPRVVETILRQIDGLSKKDRRNKSKAAMKRRMAEGYRPNFAKK